MDFWLLGIGFVLRNNIIPGAPGSALRFEIAWQDGVCGQLRKPRKARDGFPARRDACFPVVLTSILMLITSSIVRYAFPMNRAFRFAST